MEWRWPPSWQAYFECSPFWIEMYFWNMWFWWLRANAAVEKWQTAEVGEVSCRSGDEIQRTQNQRGSLKYQVEWHPFDRLQFLRIEPSSADESKPNILVRRGPGYPGHDCCIGRHLSTISGVDPVRSDTHEYPTKRVPHVFIDSSTKVDASVPQVVGPHSWCRHSYRRRPVLGPFYPMSHMPSHVRREERDYI